MSSEVKIALRDNHCFTQWFQEHPLTVEFGEDIAEFTIAGLRLSLEFSILFAKSANLIYIQIMICKAYINTGSSVVRTYNIQDSILKSFKILICCSIFIEISWHFV